jgi:hypothetical protein
LIKILTQPPAGIFKLFLEDRSVMAHSPRGTEPKNRNQRKETGFSQTKKLKNGCSAFDLTVQSEQRDAISLTITIAHGIEKRCGSGGLNATGIAYRSHSFAATAEQVCGAEQRIALLTTGIVGGRLA